MIKYIKNLFDKRYVKKSITRQLTGMLVSANYLKSRRGIVCFYVYVKPIPEIDNVFKMLRASIKNDKDVHAYCMGIKGNRAIIYIEANATTVNRVPAILGKEDAYLAPEIIDSNTYQIIIMDLYSHVTIRGIKNGHRNRD